MTTTRDLPGPAYGTIGWAHNDGTIRVKLAGEIDLSCREQIEKATTAITDAMPRNVLVDVTGVTFCGSEGLRLLADAVRIAAVEHGKRVTVHNPDRHLKHILELFGILDQLAITSD